VAARWRGISPSASDTDEAAVPVASGGTDLTSGTQVSGPLTLPPLAVAVLAYPRY
jgi:hypothetical protein